MKLFAEYIGIVPVFFNYFRVDGIRAIVRSILSCSRKVVFSLEGGYNLDALSDSVRTTIEEMLSRQRPT